MTDTPNNETARSKTGITTLDEILYGGIPQGSCVLLSGATGTGKTILSLQYLFNGISQFNEPGVYLSMTEPISKILQNLETMKFYNREAIEYGLIRTLDLRELSDRVSGREGKIILENPDAVLETIKSTVESIDARRFCLDSITALCYHLKDEAQIRSFIFRLGSILSALNCTAILTSEVKASSEDYSVFGVEEFIADGVIRVGRYKRKGMLFRTIQVVKMRGTEHQQAEYMLELNSEGARISPLFRPGEEP